MLFLIATPIGNLQDLTFRAKHILEEVDYILCEDTRKSSILLNHYGIHKPLISFHQFNEKKREEQILRDLQNHKKIALITDAGTPAICDPGSRLVQKCRELGLPFTSLPGPCAFVTALTLLGEEVSCFQFLGFLPKKASELRQTLLTMLLYPYHSLCYETPHHLLKTLQALCNLHPKKQLTLVKELTKIHENIQTHSVDHFIEHYTLQPPRGEYILIVKGEKPSPSLSPQEYVHFLCETYNLSLKEAIKLSSETTSSSKRALYNHLRT